MASVTIGNLPDDIEQRLRQRATGNGRSPEEEARRAPLALVTPREERRSIGQMLFEASRPGVDLPIPSRSRARIPDLDEWSWSTPTSGANSSGRHRSRA